MSILTAANAALCSWTGLQPKPGTAYACMLDFLAEVAQGSLLDTYIHVRITVRHILRSHHSYRCDIHALCMVGAVHSKIAHTVNVSPYICMHTDNMMHLEGGNAVCFASTHILMKRWPLWL